MVEEFTSVKRKSLGQIQILGDSPTQIQNLGQRERELGKIFICIYMYVNVHIWLYIQMKIKMHYYEDSL